jgi:hypothetical protein
MPTSNPANEIDVGKIKIQWRGTYNPSIEYEADDVVLYDDGVSVSSYICVLDNTIGQAPSTTNVVNSTYWNLLSRGADPASFGTLDGSIQYKSSSGYGGESAFIWDEANNRLGINSSSPTTTLDVNGTINCTNYDLTNVNLTVASNFLANDGADDPFNKVTRIDDTLKISELCQTTVITANTANSTSNIDVKSGNVWIFTSNSTATWTHNIRGDASTSLNNFLSIGESVCVNVISKQNNSSYFTNALQVDGTNRTLYWINNTSSSSANTGSSGYDLYTWNILKTANNSFIVLGNKDNYR